MRTIREVEKLVAMGTPMSVFGPAKSYLLIPALASLASLLNNVALVATKQTALSKQDLPW